MRNLNDGVTVILAISIMLLTHTAQAATLSGRVLFEGTPPEAQSVGADADPACQVSHPDGVPMEEVVVNANGTLKNVFIYVKEGSSSQTFETPETPVVLDQRGCRYEPHVLGIQVNQPLEIVNSDDTLHNVHALAKNTKEFNLGMPVKGMKLTKTFTAPEVMVKVKCEVHPWMATYIGVLEHPFFSVTNSEGTFEIKNLPAGQYALEAWHEKYGALTQSVTIGSAEETQQIIFQYKG
ncbi:MAG: hypothetical protein HYS56_06125 [Candidatus Omnitrophica bacterium]|nr:hypothetical protein [Candidatus Omnitrophota bacterium]